MHNEIDTLNPLPAPRRNADDMGLPTKRRIYCVTRQSDGDTLVLALGEDGVVLAQHTSSNPAWARRDIGLDGSERKHTLYDSHFGAGQWDLVWLGDNLKDAEYQAALTLHRQKP